MEFSSDTGRCLVSLGISGAVDRYPGIHLLVSHCGATILPLIERLYSLSSRILDTGVGVSPDRVKEMFKNNFYFNLAEFPFPDLSNGFLRCGDPSRLLYGSDYPYTPLFAIDYFTNTMHSGLKRLFDDETVGQIYNDNGSRLLNFLLRPQDHRPSRS